MGLSKRNLLMGTASAAALAGLVGQRPSPARAADAADVIIFGGPIVTMSETQPNAEAVAVKDGKIAALGAAADIRARWEGPGTRLINLEGKVLLPGFIDAHGHFMMAPRIVSWANLSSVPVGSARTISDVIKALQDNAAALSRPKGAWVMGYGYDATALADHREMTRDDLDPYFPDNPVMAVHISGHGAVFNSAALKIFNVTAETPTPPGGFIARKSGSNEPAGLLMETAFMPIVEKLPQPNEDDLLALLKPAQQMYASKGITTAQEGATHAEELVFLRKAGERGHLHIDIVSLPFIAEVPKIFLSYLSPGPDGKLVPIGDPSVEFNTYKNRLKLGGIKLVIDGSPQGKTAYWTKPLLTGGPNGEKDWTGQPVFPKDLVDKVYKTLTEKNIQVWSHANGDAAIDLVISAAGKAGVKAGDDRRYVVVHSQCMRPDQLDAYVKLGLSPSFFTVHTFFWGDVHLANLGEERAFFLSPMKSALTKGLRFSNHNDFMVTPIDPMMMIWSAVTRKSKTGVVIGPDERVEVMTALKALTVEPAWQYREEASKGSIEIGKLADLVILDKNPLTAKIDDIPGIKVVETLKEGKTIYTTGEKAGAIEHSPPTRHAMALPGALLTGNGTMSTVGCACCEGSLTEARRAAALTSVTEFASSPLWG